MVDDYIRYMGAICDNIEETYGLNNEVDGKKLSDLTIRELVPFLNKELATAGERKIEDRNLSVWPHIGTLAHFLGRFKYYNNFSRLNFAGYPKLDELIRVLQIFLSNKTLNPTTRNEANVIASVLDYVETKELELRFERDLEYRFLRVFLILVLHSNYGEASIVADCLLWHMKGVNSRAKSS